MVGLIGCNRTDKSRNLEKLEMKIAFEIIPEEKDYYSISWKDTLGQKNCYELYNRPLEIWCVIEDSKDTIGYYKGMSTSQHNQRLDTIQEIVELDSNNIIKFYDLRYKYFSYDTIINFKGINYNIITKRKEYSVSFKIYKDEKIIIDDSANICGPYKVDLEDFNNDSYPDFRLDYRNLKNTLTYLYVWNPNLSKFTNLGLFHDVNFFKPNYFSSDNIFGAQTYYITFYKLFGFDSCKIIKEFYIDFSCYIEDDCYVVIDSQDTIRTGLDIDKCYDIVNKYRQKIINEP